MGRLITWIKRERYTLLFAVAGTIVVLWQMLLPGYVLTWDMTFGPINLVAESSGFLNSLPLKYFIYVFALVLPMWVVQKILLVSLFFLLFYLPVKFFPFDIDIRARYVGAALYAVNPFVYERLLAGQINVHFGYALLAPFIYFLLKIISAPAARDSVYLALTMLLIGVFSLHTFVMAVIVAFIVIVLALVRNLAVRDMGALALLGKRAAVAASIVVVVSMYWILPFLLGSQNSPLSGFGVEDWKAFETSSQSLLGATGNVLMLYGFWGEAYPWMQNFLSPKDLPEVFLPALIALSAIIFIGVVKILRAREERARGVILIFIGTIAFIFSVGLAPTIFHSFNQWLFENISFWGGFRDTQKWSMWLALTYAYLFAAGASHVLSKLRPRLKNIAICAFVLLPFIYTYTMLGGLSWQIKPVWYPVEWSQVNEILSDEDNCIAIFLPWHQYYELEFNNRLLTGNVASKYFDCEIISSVDAEIGKVGYASNKTGKYYEIANAITNNKADPNDTVLLLNESGAKYVIFTPDISSHDPYLYNFLNSKLLDKIYENSSITLYKLDF
jgi:hypothetical protein